MKQLTLSTGSFDRYGKTTRRAAFLAEMADHLPDQLFRCRWTKHGRKFCCDIVGGVAALLVAGFKHFRAADLEHNSHFFRIGLQSL